MGGLCPEGEGLDGALKKVLPEEVLLVEAIFREIVPLGLEAKFLEVVLEVLSIDEDDCFESIHEVLSGKRRSVLSAVAHAKKSSARSFYSNRRGLASLRSTGS
jgi:hypothetical protein